MMVPNLVETGLDCGRSSEKERKKESKSIMDSLIPAHFAEKLTY
jgi:hypothetical protein